MDPALEEHVVVTAPAPLAICMYKYISTQLPHICLYEYIATSTELVLYVLDREIQDFSGYSMYSIVRMSLILRPL